MRNGSATGVRWLIVRVPLDAGGGAAARKRAADEVHLYRGNGFQEAYLDAGALRSPDGSVALPEEWTSAVDRDSRWMVARVG